MIRTLMIVAGTVLAATAVSLPPALSCPEVADAYTATGWQEYRADRVTRAHIAFTAAQARCPDHVESRLGLGYVALRTGALDTARAHFETVLRADNRHVDALAGLGLAAWRAGRHEEARSLFEQVLRLDPARDDVRGHLAAVPASPEPRPDRPPLVLPDSVVVHARVNGEQLEVRTRAGWAPFYVKGVNLGAALPGRFPSEFPEASTYRRWVAEIAEMGANTIRVYTLHPPAFYEAVAAHNAEHPDRPLWLLHGVWAELPPRDDYHDRAWRMDFFGEVERVIDALHGRADVEPRPGHAAGYYTADVSRWTLGLILGREWEPYSVSEFNDRNAGPRAWAGRYVTIADAPAMDAWLAEALDHAVEYETRVYRMQRPVAYTNWPTLDPMRHPVELGSQQELSIRGVPFDRTRRAHNEDEVDVGRVPMATTPAFRAGYFAAFHIYPYYPDFLLHDAGYNAVESPLGPSSYYGYLLDLKRHFPGIPLVVAEYGVPSSWGISHLNPQGWHHGGHTERAAAEINVRLTREIAAAGMAGGILFAWIDEWFKHNWLEDPQEQPAERSRMWWNRMNPEQHYGVNALEPVKRLGETLEERRAGWDTVAAAYETADGSRIRAHADEAYLWLQLSGPIAGAARVAVGLDIIDAATGALRFPGEDAPRSPAGLEYVMQLDSAGARILGAPGVFPVDVRSLPRGATRRDEVTDIVDRPPGFFVGSYTHEVRPARATAARADGRFDRLLTVVNRARVSADSVNHLGMGYDRGVLREGPLPDGVWERTDAGEVEVRLPWSLIGVTDPSSRHVAHAAIAGALQVDAIRIVAAARSRRGEWQLWPASGSAADVASITWPVWDQPQFRSRRRPVFDAMRKVFSEPLPVSRVVNP
ncbi:MAG TPA: tetratricopeptide repeat protein [Longimicrobiales bacterium]